LDACVGFSARFCDEAFLSLRIGVTFCARPVVGHVFSLGFVAPNNWSPLKLGRTILSCAYYTVVALERRAARRRVGDGGFEGEWEFPPIGERAGARVPHIASVPGVSASLLPGSRGPMSTGAPIERMPEAPPREVERGLGAGSAGLFALGSPPRVAGGACVARRPISRLLFPGLPW
jgi:hypothetical protein